MIEFDYLIKRDEIDEIREYKPEAIPNKLPGLVRIEAPNSSGKSTLLNIIAAGFYGHKDDSINKDLRGKINNLINSDHQKLSFELKLHDSKNNLVLRSKKNSENLPEIDVFRIEDGTEQRISKEIFEKHYKLIYDIPDNPISRLNQLVSEIQEFQKEYGYKVRDGTSKLRSVITELKDARDEDTIEKKRKELNNINKSIEDNEKELRSLEPGLEKMKKFWATNYYMFYLSLFEKKRRQEHDQRETVKKFSNDSISVEKDYSKNESKLRKELEKLEETHSEVYDLMNALLDDPEKSHIKSWINISFSEISDTLQIPDSVSKDIRFFRGKILDLEKNRTLKKSAADAKIISDLIEVLEEYRRSGNRIPNVDIDYLIEEITKQKSEKEDDYNFSNLLQSARSKIEDYEKLKQQLDQKTFSKVYTSRKEFKQRDPEGSQKAAEQRKLLDIRNKKEEYERFMDSYLAECIKLNIDRDEISNTLSDLKKDQLIKGYLEYNERDLKESIDVLEDKLFTIKQGIKNNENIKPILKSELERLERKEPHKYQDRQKDIDLLFSKFLSVEQKMLQNFDKYLKQVKDKKEANSQDEENYRIGISHYLANRIGRIRHLDQSYYLESVDLPNGIIKTQTGKEIRINDMGTGQTQSAYLIGLLGSEDNRQIIALFDEVSTMDSKSISSLQEKMRELYDKEKLALGIIVQPADEAKIMPF